MPATPQPIGFAAASRRATFPSPSGTPVGRPFPRTSTVRVHALGPRLLFEVSSPLLLVAPRPSNHSCRGSFPLRDITDGVYALAGTVWRPRGLLTSHGRTQPPASFRPQVFSTSRRFAPPSDSRACFIPQPRPGFSIRPGVSPVAQRSSTRRRALPPCRCCAPTGRRPGRRERASRLRGFVPCNEAFLRVRV